MIEYDIYETRLAVVVQFTGTPDEMKDVAEWADMAKIPHLYMPNSMSQLDYVHLYLPLPVAKHDSLLVSLKLRFG